MWGRGSVVNKNGRRFSAHQWEALQRLLDTDICYELDWRLSRKNANQEYFSAYEAAYEKKYGKEWTLSRAKPAYV